MPKDSQSKPPLTFRAGGPLGPAAGELTYCYITACERKAVARGLCSTHYHQAWRSDQLPIRGDRPPPLARETIWVEKDMAARLRKLSRSTGRTVSEICREAIAKYVVGA